MLFKQALIRKYRSNALNLLLKMQNKFSPALFENLKDELLSFSDNEKIKDNRIIYRCFVITYFDTVRHNINNYDDVGNFILQLIELQKKEEFKNLNQIKVSELKNLLLKIKYRKITFLKYIDKLEIIDQVKRGVCELRSINAQNKLVSGTGFYIGNGLILTNQHLICTNDYENGSFTYNQGIECNFSYSKIKDEKILIKILKIDLKNDLALLKIMSTTSLEDLYVLDIVKDYEYSLGEEVFTIGNTINLGLAYIHGTISKVEDVNYTNGYPSLRIDAHIYDGNSGGPVLNSRGKVIGIIKSVLTSNNKECNALTSVTKLKAINELIEQDN